MWTKTTGHDIQQFPMTYSYEFKGKVLKAIIKLDSVNILKHLEMLTIQYNCLISHTFRKFTVEPMTKCRNDSNGKIENLFEARCNEKYRFTSPQCLVIVASRYLRLS